MVLNILFSGLKVSTTRLQYKIIKLRSASPWKACMKYVSSRGQQRSKLAYEIT